MNVTGYRVMIFEVFAWLEDLEIVLCVYDRHLLSTFQILLFFKAMRAGGPFQQLDSAGRAPPEGDPSAEQVRPVVM